MESQKVIKVFITGATGYIGGSVATLFLKNPEKYQVFTLVRKEGDAEKLKAAGATPVLGSLDDTEIITQAAAEADIVINTAVTDHPTAIKAMIEGLKKGTRGIYIHTSGTGILIDNVKGESTGTTITSDLESEKINNFPAGTRHMDTNNFIHSNSKEITTIIVCPSLIYGFGTGLFNIQSIHIPYMIRAFVKRGKAGTFGKGLNIWGTVHVQDLADFYFLVAEKALEGKADAGPNGWYFCEKGELRFDDLTKRLAEILERRKLINTTEIDQLTDEEVGTYFFGQMGWSIWASNSRSKGERSRALGWNPQREDVFSTLEAEVDKTLAEQKAE